jgi:hypothetical protein
MRERMAVRYRVDEQRVEIRHDRKAYRRDHDASVRAGKAELRGNETDSAMREDSGHLPCHTPGGGNEFFAGLEGMRGQA